jgi:hypothetical protein
MRIAMLLMCAALGGCCCSGNSRGPTAPTNVSAPEVQPKVEVDAASAEGEAETARWRAEAERVFREEEQRPWRVLAEISGSDNRDEWSDPVVAEDVTIRIFGAVQEGQSLQVEVEKNGEFESVFAWPLPANFTTDGKFFSSRPGDVFRFKVVSRPAAKWTLIVQSK